MSNYHMYCVDDTRQIILPVKAKYGDAAVDLPYNPPGEGNYANVEPGTTAMFETGIRISLEWDQIGLVLSRSGLARNSVWVANAPGLIDPGYTGEIMVLLYNGSKEIITVTRGDRIGQLLVLKQEAVVPIYYRQLIERHDSGFGSSGL